MDDQADNSPRPSLWGGSAGPVAVVVAVLTGMAFGMVTTFTGDDHLFLAFARHAANPLLPFVRDQHGGEFYRPLPMMLWWLLGRLSGGTRALFVALSFGLHVVASWQVGALVVALHRRDTRESARQVRSAQLASALFFLAPVTQGAAFWYSASTDLLATVFGLACVRALLDGQRGRAAVWFAGACWSKESALIVPLLALVTLSSQDHPPSWRRTARQVIVLAPVAILYGVARTIVLGGVGNPSDDAAPLLGKIVQILAGLVHIFSGEAIAADGAAWTVGLLAWTALLAGALRVRRKRGTAVVSLTALAWIGIAVLPLLGAPWVVGARYFYLPAVGVAWFAGQLLSLAPNAVVVGVLAALGGLDLAQDLGRWAEVQSYEGRLAAARRAVAEGVAHGHNVFHVAAGIKDLDLALKEDRPLAARDGELLVLGDVPASFISVPEHRMAELDFLLAKPPLPPAGSYSFGDRRIVALARRGDDPTLDEVMARFPTIRFIRLRLGPGNRIIARDMTDSFRRPESGED